MTSDISTTPPPPPPPASMPPPTPRDFAGLSADPLVSYNPDRSLLNATTLGCGDEPPRTLPAHGRARIPAPSQPAHRTGRRGPFSLLGVVGAGGVGEVWQATQNSLDRVVAVKRLRETTYAETHGDAAAREFVERMFRQEALTNASLEHPNIVPVYDYGDDDEGRPQIAMKLVRGTPWDAMLRADFAALAPADLLARHLPILIDVANAVAFAHSVGIVHRDLKPSQVMVGRFGEVLLMDWGLAIQFDVHAHHATAAPRPAGAVAPTRDTAGSPAGTPAFMAPEQTDETAERIGPWTDVYLLGGILYYLLTMTPPHLAPNSKAAIERARRGTIDPPGLRAPERDHPPDLRDLCLAALAADPAARLQSVEPFIAAVKDHLSGAGRRRESAALTSTARERAAEAAGGYLQIADALNAVERALVLWPENDDATALRGRLFLRYARAALANGDLMLARLQAERMDAGDARDALLADVRELEEAKHATDLRAARAYEEAQEARSDADDLLSFMLGDLRDRLEPIGRLDVLDAVGDRALRYFDRLGRREREVSAGTREHQATALRHIGQVRHGMGRLEEAAEALERALALDRQLVAERPTDTARLHSLGDTIRWYGNIHEARGRFAEALALYREALTIYEAAREIAPEVPRWVLEHGDCHGHIGRVLQAEGDVEGARRHLGQFLALSQEAVNRSPEESRFLKGLGVALNYMAGLLSATGDREGALDHSRRERALCATMSGREPGNILWQRNLCIASDSIGWALESEGKLPEALAEYEVSQSTMKRLCTRDPANADWARELSVTHNNVGRVRRGLGDLDGAAEHFAAGLAIMRDLTARDPTNSDWAFDRAVSHALVGETALRRGRVEQARQDAQMAHDLLAPLAAAGDEAPSHIVRWFARTHLVLGHVRQAQGDTAGAGAAFAQAADLLGPRASRHPEPRFLDPFVKALLLSGRADEARPWAEKLAALGWRDAEFLELCRGAGMALSPE